MPSKVVDTLWHEFILYTRGYEMFCRRAFGRLLHHTPAEAMRRRHGAQQEGLRRAWRYACLEERIDPRKPGRLPLLFALDALLAIEGGYRYVPDCSLTEASGRGDQCAADIGCGASSCGGSSSSDSGSSGDGGGDGSGCGGGGCGGGD